ncbi:MAG: UDP-N-acetylglucosamine 1-carboxyvinyltransferase [Bifidobacteriaceae bacterium]|jgi:UDP-N-acetylglucosamine 1-carboxyvinyltransferase|nr:UDP-N-acetylglucosamine 1-carboxyvinyltransferase [Bifidobacteriaceae bacterium]
MNGVLEIEGGRPLAGEIRVRGAKNFVSKAMVASLLGEGISVLRNVPTIRDVEIVLGLLRAHGVGVEHDPVAGTVTMNPTGAGVAKSADIITHAGASRIPILLCGPLLHRLGEAFIPDLGGCNIGGRPIDFHMEALRRFGAEVSKEPDGLRLVAPKRLQGMQMELEFPSVGATEQLLLTAVLAEGITELRGAAVEPEILDLVAVLQQMGAIITLETDRTYRIEGVDSLHGYHHYSLPDRIEAASWAGAALATGGDITVLGARQLDLTTYLNYFRKVGGRFDVTDDGIRFWHAGGDLSSIAVETAVHPGFMTDWQQPFVVALTQASGISIIHETVYEKRFGFTNALRRMGAHIQLYRECLGGQRLCRFGQRNYEHSAVISGPTPLHAADIEVPDLRGGFSHLIAALAAEGRSSVSGISLIDRGYESFTDKLDALGARYWRH